MQDGTASHELPFNLFLKDNYYCKKYDILSENKTFHMLPAVKTPIECWPPIQVAYMSGGSQLSLLCKTFKMSLADSQESDEQNSPFKGSDITEKLYIETVTFSFFFSKPVYLFIHMHTPPSSQTDIA